MKKVKVMSIVAIAFYLGVNLIVGWQSELGALNMLNATGMVALVLALSKQI